MIITILTIIAHLYPQVLSEWLSKIKMDTPQKPKQMAQVFSGSLENCVINFYNHSDSK